MRQEQERFLIGGSGEARHEADRTGLALEGGGLDAFLVEDTFEVGDCLRESLRLVDAAFRYGGDEFAILLPQTSGEAGLRVARRIAKVFHERLWLPQEAFGLQVRASIGIATYPTDGTTPQIIVQHADDMMYAVKQAGRDNIAVSGVGIVGLDED